MPSIDVRYDRGRYTVYVNGEFWSTCDNAAEVREEKDYIFNYYKERKQ